MATFTERVSAAVQVFRKGYPAAVRYGKISAAPDESKASPIVWPQFRLGQPSWEMVDSAAYIDEGFNANSLIYAAVMAKGRAESAAPLRAYRGDPDSPELLPADAPLAQLCAMPNPSMSWQEFQMLASIYLNLTGNAYAYVDREGSTDGAPTALYILSPIRVRIVPKDRHKIGYVYIPEGRSAADGIPIPLQDMIHVKLPNPGDPLDGEGYGLPPMSAIARSADVDNIITKFIQLFFEHGALTAGILKFNQPLNDTVIARIKERWQEMYGGYENWTQVGVLDQSGEYQRISLTFEEMGFEALDERNETRILSAFGVPPILIGSRIGLMRSTYSNYEQARRAFWQDTIMPEMGLFQSAYSYYLQDNAGGFVRFDFSEIDALRTDIATTAPVYHAAFVNGAITIDEYRAVLGLDAIEGGNVRIMPMSMLQVGTQPEAAQDETQASAVDDERAKALTELAQELKAARLALMSGESIEESPAAIEQYNALMGNNGHAQQESAQ